MSMIRTKMMSVMRMTIKLSFVLWMLTTLQAHSTGTHAARIYEYDKSKRPMILFESIDYSPARHLVPSNI
jgi:hypothetical protein